MSHSDKSNSLVISKLVFDIVLKFVCYVVVFKVYLHFIHPRIKRKRLQKKMLRQHADEHLIQKNVETAKDGGPTSKEFDNDNPSKGTKAESSDHGQTDFEKEVETLHNLVMARKRQGKGKNRHNTESVKSAEKLMEELWRITQPEKKKRSCH